MVSQCLPLYSRPRPMSAQAGKATRMQPSEIFVISPAKNGAWEVKQHYLFRKSLFLTREEAERFARQQARGVHPSEVVLMDENDRVIWRELYTGVANTRA
jgi:Uncharacterized protein conserved in bacteria (DUF2188)